MKYYQIKKHFKTIGIIAIIAIIYLSISIYNNSIESKYSTSNSNIKKEVIKIEKEEKNTLLKFSVLNDKVSDTPLKTEIITEILLDKKEVITENKLETLLKTLYVKQKKRKGFKYHKTPNSVAVYAYLSKQKALSGMGQWVGMISKTNINNNSNPVFKINKTQLKSINEKAEILWKLSDKKRREIWRKMILAERYGFEMAQKIHPIKAGSTQEDLKKGGELISKWQLVKEKEILKEYKVNRQFLDSIVLEGLIKGWTFPK
jgi:hypothetical protein